MCILVFHVFNVLFSYRNTNAYAELHKHEKPYYCNRQGDFLPVTVAELQKFLGLIVYMGLVKVGIIYSRMDTLTWLLLTLLVLRFLLCMTSGRQSHCITVCGQDLYVSAQVQVFAGISACGGPQNRTG